jgi:hypothetical protein
MKYRKVHDSSLEYLAQTLRLLLFAREGSGPVDLPPDAPQIEINVSDSPVSGAEWVPADGGRPREITEGHLRCLVNFAYALRLALFARDGSRNGGLPSVGGPTIKIRLIKAAKVEAPDRQ